MAGKVLLPNVTIAVKNPAKTFTGLQKLVLSFFVRNCRRAHDRREPGKDGDMKNRVIAIIAMFWILGGFPVLAVHAADYKLAMSEEKDVCQLMLKFSKVGLLETKNLESLPQLDTPEFLFVEWGATKLAPSFHGHNGNVEDALVDMNNDGQLDWVVRIQWALGGLYSHEIGIYGRRQEPLFQDVGFDERDLGKADAHLRLVGRQYFLTKLPQQKFKDGKSSYYDIVPAYLIPFQFKNVAYILMANPFARPELVKKRFAVVAKYLSTFQLLDICYIEEK